MIRRGRICDATADRTPREAHHGALGDLQVERVLLEPGDPAEEAAGRHDLVALPELRLNGLDRAEPPAREHHEQRDAGHDDEAEIERRKHRTESPTSTAEEPLI